MNKREEFDNLMYLLGEENSIEELNHSTIKHKFSNEYKKRKEDLINKYENDGTQELEVVSSSIQMKNRKKRFIVLSAAIVATLAISLTAYGIAQRYETKGERNKETGTFTMDVRPILKNDKVPLIKINPGYLPEGYVELKDTPGKYHLSGSNNTGGISILPLYNPNDFKDSYVSNVEDTTIGGIKAKILTREGIDFKHIIYLLYENEGQIIKIYGYETVSLDELIKVAENITYEEVPGYFVEIPACSAEKASDNEQSYEVVNPEVVNENIFGINDVRSDFIARGMEGLEYKVKNIEILDKLQDIDPTYFCRVENVIDEYDTYLQYLNEDGTLKEYERTNSEHWENDKMNRETEIVGMKFIYVTVEVTNTSEEDLIDRYFAPRIIYLQENSNKILEEVWRYPSMHGLQIEDVPFYYDKGDYQGSHYRFADFKAKETYEIHLAYAVDEDYLDRAYVSFNSTRYTTLNPRDVKESYIKVLQ